MLDSDVMRNMHVFNFDASNSMFHVHVFVSEDPFKTDAVSKGFTKINYK